MLSYQHIYHAGNFADVQKHAVLSQLLRTLALKSQPFCFMDTHAGRGLYDLSSPEALKVGEFKTGILPFWTARAEKSPLSPYLDALARFNEGEELVIYPGSCKIAQSMMRPKDSLILVEKHPGEFSELEKAFKDVPHASVEKADGFRRMVEKVPFTQRRGLVLIDPSYEIKSEYEDLPRHLRSAYKKWPQGQFMVWYPLLKAGRHREMLTALRQTEVKDMLVSEIRLDAVQAGLGMYGSGVLITNPPFGFENMLKEITGFIADRLPEKATGEVFWLDNREISPETGMVAN
jgi:23S rRNA (adenine2030-N6)-methyltransferase